MRSTLPWLDGSEHAAKRPKGTRSRAQPPKSDPPLVDCRDWPVGIALTSWDDMWRTTPMHRREGSAKSSLPASLLSYPAEVSAAERRVTRTERTAFHRQ